MEVFPPDDPQSNEVGSRPTVSQFEQMKSWDDSFANLEKVLQACEKSNDSHKDLNSCSIESAVSSAAETESPVNKTDISRKWDADIVDTTDCNKQTFNHMNNMILNSGEVTIQLVNSPGENCDNLPISNLLSSIKTEQRTKYEDFTFEMPSEKEPSDTKDALEFIKLEPKSEIKNENEGFKTETKPDIFADIKKSSCLTEDNFSTDIKMIVSREIKSDSGFTDDLSTESKHEYYPQNDDPLSYNVKEETDDLKSNLESKCSVLSTVSNVLSDNISSISSPLTKDSEELSSFDKNETSEQGIEEKIEDKDKKDEINDKNIKKEDKLLKKKKFERCNIRDIKLEDELDAVTLSAQKEEQERIRRLQEAQMRALQERLQQIEVEKEALSQLFSQSTDDASALFDSNSLSEDVPCEKKVTVKTENDVVLVESDEDKKAKLQNVISTAIATPIEENIIDISSSSSGNESDSDDSDKKDDDIMVLSDEGADEGESPEDPNNSGAHTNDCFNLPDEEGRVLVNVGHPPEDPDIFLAPQIAKVIKPHQIGGIRFLYDNVVENLERYKSSSGFGCILAHSMGLGKTVQVVSFVDVFLRHTPATLVLCIVPINTIQNWKAEFDMWVPPSNCVDDNLVLSGEIRPRDYNIYTLNENFKTMAARASLIAEWRKNGGVLLMGYEMYRMLALRKMPKIPVKKSKRLKKLELSMEPETNDQIKKYMEEMYEHIVIPGPDLVICDEGHRIKNSLASTSMALKSIKTRRRVVLTGYPLQNNLLEYWCMVDFVRPNYLGSRAEFCNMFERPISNGQCIDSTPRDRQLMRFRSHVLHSLLVGFVQRRGHSVLRAVLPKKEEHVLLIRMTPIQRQLYKCFVKDLLYVQQATNPLKLFAVCCKIWNHPDILYKLLQEKKAQEDIDLDIDIAMAASSGVPGASCGGKKRAYQTKSKVMQRSLKALPRSLKSEPNFASTSDIIKTEQISCDQGNIQQINDIKFDSHDLNKDDYSVSSQSSVNTQNEYSQQGTQNFQNTYGLKNTINPQFCQTNYDVTSNMQFPVTSPSNAHYGSKSNMQSSQQQFTSQASSQSIPQNAFASTVETEYGQSSKNQFSLGNTQKFPQVDSQIQPQYGIRANQETSTNHPQSPQANYQAKSQTFSSRSNSCSKYSQQADLLKQLQNSSKELGTTQSSSNPETSFSESPLPTNQKFVQPSQQYSQNSQQTYNNAQTTQQYSQQSFNQTSRSQFQEQTSSEFPQQAIGNQPQSTFPQASNQSTPVSEPSSVHHFSSQSPFQQSPPHSQFSQNSSQQSSSLTHQQFGQQTSFPQLTQQYDQQQSTHGSPSQPSPPTQSQFSQVTSNQAYQQQFSQQSSEFSQNPVHQSFQQQNVQSFSDQQSQFHSNQSYNDNNQSFTQQQPSQQQFSQQTFSQSYLQGGQQYSQQTSQENAISAFGGSNQFQSSSQVSKFSSKQGQQNTFSQPQHSAMENIQYSSQNSQPMGQKQMGNSPSEKGNKQAKFNQQTYSEPSSDGQYAQIGQSTGFPQQLSQSDSQSFTEQIANMTSQYAAQSTTSLQFPSQTSNSTQYNTQSSTSRESLNTSQFQQENQVSEQFVSSSQQYNEQASQYPQQPLQNHQQFTKQSGNAQQFDSNNQMFSQSSQFSQQTSQSQKMYSQQMTQNSQQSGQNVSQYDQQISTSYSPKQSQLSQQFAQHSQSQQYPQQPSQSSQKFHQQPTVNSQSYNQSGGQSSQLYQQQTSVSSQQYSQPLPQSSQEFSQQQPNSSQSYSQQTQASPQYTQQSMSSQMFGESLGQSSQLFNQVSNQSSQQFTASDQQSTPQISQTSVQSPQQFNQGATQSYEKPTNQNSQQHNPSNQSSQYSQPTSQASHQFNQATNIYNQSSQAYKHTVQNPQYNQSSQQYNQSNQSQFSQKGLQNSQQYSQQSYPQQPSQSPQQYIQQPVQSPQQFNQPVQSPQQFSQPVQSPQQFHQQPSQSPQQYSQHPVQSPQQFNQPPVPSPQQFNQPPIQSPQQFSQQPTPSPQFSQPSPSPQFSQPAPSPQQFSQTAQSPQQFSQPTASPQQFSQTAQSPQQFSQPAPSPQQFSQPTPSPQQFSQPVPSPQHFPQSNPSPQQYSQPNPSPQQFSQPNPSPQPFSQSSPSTQQFNQTSASSQQYNQISQQNSQGQYTQQTSQNFPQQSSPASSNQQYSSHLSSSPQYKQQNVQSSQYSTAQQCMPGAQTQFSNSFSQLSNRASPKTPFQTDYQNQPNSSSQILANQAINQQTGKQTSRGCKSKQSRVKPLNQTHFPQTSQGNIKQPPSFSVQAFQNGNQSNVLQRSMGQPPVKSLQESGNSLFQPLSNSVSNQEGFTLQHLSQDPANAYSAKCPKAILQPVKHQTQDSSQPSQMNTDILQNEMESKNVNANDTSVVPFRDRVDSSINYEWAIPIMKDYVLGVLENSHKMMVLFVIIAETLQMGDKLLVFSQSLSTLDLLEQFLCKIQLPKKPDHPEQIETETWSRNKNYFRLDGSTSAQEREKLINEFNRNDNVSLFLLSTRAGCLGINLVGANRIVVMDASWNPCHDAQAVCRIYRYGQKKQCYIYRLVTDNSLEKRIYDRQVNKQGMSDRVVDELNPESNFTWKDVTTLIQDDEDDGPVQELSKFATSYTDKVLKFLVSEMSSSLSKEPFEHESLLLDRKDLKLTKQEKRLAKQSYEMAKRANMINIRTTYTYLPTGTSGGGQFVINNKQCQWVGGTTIRVLPNQTNAATGNARSGTTATPITASPTLMSSLFKQGVMVQKLTMPSNVSIPVLTPGAPPVVIPAGQDVLVLRTPKGVYLRLPDGRIIAVQLPPSLLAKTQFRPNVVTHFRPAAPKGANQSTTVINTPRGQSIGIIKQTLQCGGTVRYLGPRNAAGSSGQNSSRGSAPEVIDLSDDEEPLRKQGLMSNTSANSSESESGSGDLDKCEKSPTIFPGKHITIRKISSNSNSSSSKEKCEIPQVLSKNKQITILPVNPSAQQNRQKFAPQLAQPVRVQQMLLQPQQGKRKPIQKNATKFQMSPLLSGKSIRSQITVTPPTSTHSSFQSQKIRQSLCIQPSKNLEFSEKGIEQTSVKLNTDTSSTKIAERSSKSSPSPLPQQLQNKNSFGTTSDSGKIQGNILPPSLAALAVNPNLQITPTSRCETSVPDILPQKGFSTKSHVQNMSNPSYISNENSQTFHPIRSCLQITPSSRLETSVSDSLLKTTQHSKSPVQNVSIPSSIQIETQNSAVVSSKSGLQISSSDTMSLPDTLLSRAVGHTKSPVQNSSGLQADQIHNVVHSFNPNLQITPLPRSEPSPISDLFSQSKPAVENSPQIDHVNHTNSGMKSSHLHNKPDSSIAQLSISHNISNKSMSQLTNVSDTQTGSSELVANQHQASVQSSSVQQAQSQLTSNEVKHQNQQQAAHYLSESLLNSQMPLSSAVPSLATSQNQHISTLQNQHVSTSQNQHIPTSQNQNVPTSQNQNVPTSQNQNVSTSHNQPVTSRKRKSSNKQPSKKSHQQHLLMSQNHILQSQTMESPQPFLHPQLSDHLMPENHFPTFPHHISGSEFAPFSNFSSHKAAAHIQHPQPLHPLQHSQEHSLLPHLQHMSHLYPMPPHLAGTSLPDTQPPAPRAWPVPQPSVSSFHPFSQSSPFFSSGQESSQFSFPSSFPLPASSLTTSLTQSDSNSNVASGSDKPSRVNASDM